MAVNYSLTSNPIGNPCKNKRCRACGLYIHQQPLFAKQMAAEVFWVGLSAVQIGEGEESLPLAENTRTGSLIQQIEKPFVSRMSFYKTNLVKCVPLKNGKIRYPSLTEMGKCFPNLENEISALQPSVVFLLGKQVATFVIGSKDHLDFGLNEDFEYEPICLGGIHYIPVHHPSYVLVYKRKRLDEYITNIRRLFSALIVKQKCQ
jgi:uracil-DNA glycosylase family 4